MTMILLYLSSFLASFMFIGLKSVQQLNVVAKQYFAIVPTSLLMVSLEVYTIGVIAKNDGSSLLLILALGLGGGLGSCAATWGHNKFMKWKEKV